MRTQQKLRNLILAGAILSHGAGTAFAAATTALALRLENTACIPQAIETTFGTNVVAAPFTATTTYDFFSALLLQPTALTTAHKGSGTIFMHNGGRGAGSDFTVTAQARYYDCDPATGVNVLIVDTGASASQNVKHGKTASWSLPKVSLPASRTLAIGHKLHLTLTITRVSGNVANGQLLFNGASGTSTTVLLPENNNATWNFAAAASAPIAATILTPAAVSAYSTNNSASVTNSSACVWTISNGSIDSGQGTSQITWSAGPTGPVNLSVMVGQNCIASGAASVNVVGEPGVLALTALPDKSMVLDGSGTPGQTYQVQTTTNLAAPVWVTVTNFTADPDGLFQFTDATAGIYPCRFYRAVTP
jgi:hypothetical protein